VRVRTTDSPLGHSHQRVRSESCRRDED